VIDRDGSDPFGFAGAAETVMSAKYLVTDSLERLSRAGTDPKSPIGSARYGSSN